MGLGKGKTEHAGARDMGRNQAQADWSSSPVGPHRALLQAVAEWNIDFLPYLQDVSVRMRPVALDAAALKHSQQEVWHDLDVTG